MSIKKHPASLRNGGGMSRANSLLSASLVVMAGASVPAVACAADYVDDKENIEEITVEGRKAGSNPYADPDAPYKIDRSASSKFTEDLINIPKTINVIPKEVISDTGATSFKDLMRVQPGVTLGTGEGGNAYGDRIFIRGFDARNDVYIDGLRDPGVVSREIFAVEQVEIQKGPSSAFGGRGTTGGAVSLVSKAPQSKDFQYYEIMGGTDDLIRLTTDLNFAVSDSFQVRINGLYHESGVAGRDYVESDRWGVAIAGRWIVSENISLDMDYYHLDSDSLPDWGISYDVAANRPWDVDRNTFYGLVDRDFQKNKSDVGTVKLNAQISDDWTLTSAVRYGVTSNYYVISAPERPNVAANTLQAIAKTRDQRNKYIVNQTDLAGTVNTGGIEHELVVGFEIGNELVKNAPPTVDPRSVVQDIDNPDAFAWTGTVTRNDINDGSRLEADTLAFFLLDTIKINEQWQVLVGVRYDDFSIDSSTIENDYTDGGDQPDNEDSLWNWHAGLVYKPTELGTIYFTYSSSSNPAGEQVDGGAADYGGITEGSAVLPAERNINLELGTKWSLFDDNLAFTAALFQITKTDGIVTSGSRFDRVTTSNGKKRSRGLELSLGGNITPEWNVFGGLTLMDTEVLESDTPAAIGTAFPNVAETSLSLYSSYRVTEQFTIGGQAYYESEKFGGTEASTVGTFVPGYWRFDAFAKYYIADNIELALNVQNLTDKLYYDALYRSGTPFVYVAPGRSAHLSLEVTF